jgi:hypothetical protein
MVIGLPARSRALPAGTRIQPSLTQYSSDVRLLGPVEPDADAALKQVRVVIRAVGIGGQTVG